MAAGAIVLWRALVYFWDESLLLIRANVTWFVCSLPLYLVTVILIITAAGLLPWPQGPGDAPSASFAPVVGTASAQAADADESNGVTGTETSLLPWALAAFLLLLVPSPFSAGVYAITTPIVHGETPEFGVFWQAARRWWKRTLLMYVIGAAVLGGLIFNTIFYMSITTGLLQAVAILWVYAIVFWLTMQSYLLPLLVLAVMPPPAPAVEDERWRIDDEEEEGEALAAAEPEAPVEPLVEPTLGALYKRAAILALANPLFSLMLFIGTLFTMVLSTFAMPVYPLLAMSYIALIGCHGLKVLRDKYFPTEARGAPG